MRKTSLGIILPGNPKCVWKTPVWVKIMSVIGSWGWIPFAFFTIVSFINAFLGKAHYTLSLTFLSLFGTLVMLIFSFIFSEKCRCPYCHHFGHMMRISKDNLVSTRTAEVSRKATDYGSGTAFDWDGNMTFFTTKNNYTEYGTETTKTYTYNMRCKYCGCVNKVEKETTKTSY